MPARPFWNSAILAPRFLASAFCSGPAIHVDPLPDPEAYAPTKIEIKDEAIWKIAELNGPTRCFSISFLFGAEIFREYYLCDPPSDPHPIPFQRRPRPQLALVPFAWESLIASVVAFLLFLIPATRRNLVTLNLGCLLIYSGVFIEKGMALVIPGMTPDTLGEFYEYVPTLIEVRIGAGIFAIGFLIFHACCARSRSRPSRSRKSLRARRIPQAEAALL